MPNFFIDKFRIPPFLLPIYQAAGMQYGIRWEVLAGINEIETDYGRNLNISSAGALGWMQFMPATWKQYGVDANSDGVKDPFNPVDAIFAAARYLKAAGGDKDLRRGIFAYNHADWYVDSVLMRAQVIGGIPGDLVGSLTGLTQGRFPVRAKSTYAGALTKADRKRKGHNPAITVESKAGRKGIDIFAKAGSPVIAVNDGKVIKMGRTKRLGRYVVLQDVYGNAYTYAHLKSVAKTYPAPKPRKAKHDKPSKRRGAKELAATARPSRRPRPRPRPPPRRCACSLTRSARTRAPPAATRSSATPTRAPARRSASIPRTSARSRSSRASPCSAAPRSAGSARRPTARRRTCCSRSARPAAAPRASTRSRSSTAGSCSSRPRSTARRVRTRCSPTTARSSRSARSC